jgi:hypothetical protein
MSRQVSHDRYKQRRKQSPPAPYLTAPDESIRQLIDWLNEFETDREPVLELLRDAKELFRLSRSKASSVTCSDLIEAVNLYLGNYKAVRTVFVRHGAVGAYWGLPHAQWSLGWKPEIPENVMKKNAAKNMQHRMIHIVVDALEHGSIEKIRQCQCEKFFFARSSLARFCSVGCRVAFWESSEQRKAQKRKKAREYYWLNKRRDREAKVKAKHGYL